MFGLGLISINSFKLGFCLDKQHELGTHEVRIRKLGQIKCPYVILHLYMVLTNTIQMLLQ